MLKNASRTMVALHDDRDLCRRMGEAGRVQAELRFVNCLVSETPCLSQRRME